MSIYEGFPKGKQVSTNQSTSQANAQMSETLDLLTLLDSHLTGDMDI